MARREMPFMDHRRLIYQPVGSNKLICGRAWIATASVAIFKNAADTSCNEIKVDRWRLNV
jgi:hypothetical protein